MKKRVFSLILALALCLSLLPTAALADTADLTAQETQTGESSADVYIEGEEIAGSAPGGELDGADDIAEQSAGAGTAVQAAHANHPICGATHKDIGDANDKTSHTGECPGVTWTELTVKENKLYIGNTEAKRSGYSDDSSYSNYFTLPEGNYYLGENIELGDMICIKGTVNLCLNGHSITKNTDDKRGNDGVIIINKGSTFSLCDCQGSGKITHGTKAGGTKYIGRGVMGDVSGSVTFNMFGGEISGNYAGCTDEQQGQDGGGVCMTGSFNMYGGKITGNHIKKGSNGYGGGVYATGGTITMYGGEISNNTTTKASTSYHNGGGILSIGKAVTINGGTISGNQAVNGGGIWTNKELTISDKAVITGNTATGSGGGVYYSSSSSSYSMTVSGSAKIAENSAGGNGGGIYVGQGKVNLTGGTITNNTVTGNGGGVYFVGSSAKVYVSGDLNITGNKDTNGNNNNLYVPYTGNTDGCSPFEIANDGLDKNAKIGISYGRPIEKGKYIIFALHAERDCNESNFSSDNGGGYAIKMDVDDPGNDPSTRGTRVVKLYNGLPHEHNGVSYTQALTSENDKLYIDGVPLETTEVDIYYYTDKNFYVLPAGNYYLDGDLNLNRPLMIKGEKVSICLNGHNITAQITSTYKDTDFDTIYVCNSGDLTVNDCQSKGKITRSEHSYGSGVAVRSSSTFTLNSGIISGNGQYSPNKFTDGGGVSARGKSTFRMTGGEISENWARMGGGVEIWGSDFEMTGGTITKNLVSQHGGGILNLCNSDSSSNTSIDKTATVSGSAKVTGNTIKDSVANNIVSLGCALTVGTLNDDAEFGISVTYYGGIDSGTPLTVAKDVDTASAKRFTSDKSNYTLKLYGTTLMLTNGKDHKHGVCGTTGCEDHADVEWFPVGTESALRDAMSSGKSVYLTGHIPLTGTLKVEKDASICLNGYNLIANGNFDVITIADGVTLNLCDCQNKGVITHGKNGDATYTGRGVTVSESQSNANATFNMYGGSISGNTADYGAGVFVMDTSRQSAFHMYGGTISGNNAKLGGGVYVLYTKFTMSDGAVISGNTASESGGGIYSQGKTSTSGATITMYGGTITGNTAGKYGGGVYAWGDSFTMKNGTISENKVTGTGTFDDGGGVYVNGATFTMEDGALVTKNTKGGVSVNNGAAFTMNGGSITDNESDQAGAGVAARGESFTMNGGTISGNKSTDDGGGVYVRCAFTMNDGTITKNTSGTYGGGVCVYRDGTFIMKKGTITENTAHYGAGVGLYTDSANFDMQGGSITGNKLKEQDDLCYGGGVYFRAADEPSFKISGGAEITGNARSVRTGWNEEQGDIWEYIADNVYLSNSAVMQVTGELTGTNPIGVTTGLTPTSDSPVKIAMSGDGYTVREVDKDHFVSDRDSSTYQSIYSGGAIWLSAGDHEHPICGDKDCTDENHKLPEGQKWQPVSTLTDDMAGYYYLTGEVKLDGTWSPKNNVTLCLNGHNITRDGGSAIELTKNATLTLCDCKNKGAVRATADDGRGVCIKEGTLNLYGGTITGKQYGVYMDVYNSATNTFNMYGGTIQGCYTGVYMKTVTTTTNVFNMSGGSITGNGIGTSDTDTQYCSGSVYVGGNGTFRMSGGSITGNNHTNERGAGGVCVSGGTFEMSGSAEISGNGFTIENGSPNATHAGAGGVYVSGGTFEMSGNAKVTGNSVTNNGFKDVSGGVYVGSSGSMVVSGNVSVTGNTGSNVYLVSGKSIAIKGTLGEKAAIGVSIPAIEEGSGFTVATGAKEGDEKYFSDDSSNNYKKKFSDGSILFTNGELHRHAVCGDAGCTESGHGDVDFKALTADKLKKVTGTGSEYYDLPEGNWYLTENLNLDAKICLKDSMAVLCLNGYSITTNANADAIELIGGNRSLTLCDCNGSNNGNGVITHGTGATGRGVYISGGSSLTMYGGSIRGNTLSGSDVKGAGVYVQNNATFTMTGGKISNNTVSGNGASGAGVYNAGTTTIGGSAVISGNEMIKPEGTTLYSMDGGGIYTTSGTLTVEGDAQIINNQSTGVNSTHGGGIYVSSGTAELRGNAKVTGNQVGSYGSGICLYGGKLTVSGNVQVTGNKDVYASGADSKDSNVYFCDAYTMPITVSGALDESAHIGVTLDNNQILNGSIKLPVTIASATENWIKDGNFTSDESKYAISVTDGGTKAVFGEHTHKWVYSLTTDTTKDDTITAKCSDCDTSGGRVTIKAPTGTLRYDGKGKAAALEGSFTTGAQPTITYTQTNLTPPQVLEAGAVPTNAGTYEASITVGGVTAEVEYTINKKRLTVDDFVFTPPQNLVYDGNEKTATVTPKEGLTGIGTITLEYLERQPDPTNPGSYRYGYMHGEKPKNAGTYVVKVKIAESTNYAQNELPAKPEDYSRWMFTVAPDTTAPTVELSGDTTYTGGQITPDVTVKVGNTTLEKDTDYTVTYGTNKDVSTGGTVTITAQGNYGFAEVVKTFTITPKAVTVSGITANDKVYDGKTAATLDCSKAVFDGKVAGDELTVTATGAFESADAGTGKTVTISGLTLGGKAASNYVLAEEGQQTQTTASITAATITVTPNANQSKTYGADEPELTYTCSGAVNGETPAFEGALARAEGEKVGEYAIKLGTLKLTNGEGFKANNYDLKLAETEVKFKINKATAPTAKAGELTITNGVEDTYSFDLSTLLPKLTGSCEYGTITYGKPDTNLGEGTFVTRLNNQTGALTLEVSNRSSEKEGQFGTIKVTVTTENYQDFTLTINVSAKNKLTPVLDGALTLTPAEITYGDALSKIKITGTMKDPITGETVEGTFSWQDPNYIPENAGDYQRGWKFTPTDKNTYTEATGDVKVTVNNAKQSATLVMEGYTYGEKPFTPHLKDRTGNMEMPVTYYYFSVDGGTMQVWDIDNPPALSAGTYKMRATIAGTQNYDTFTTADVQFTVAKATPNFTNGTTYKKPTGLTAIYGQTLADVTLSNPEGNLEGTWEWMNPEESVGNASTTAKKFLAKFTPADTANYNTAENIELEVTVNKADQALLTIHIQGETSETSVTYGETLTLTTTGGTTGGKVTYSVDKQLSNGDATIDENGVLTPTKVGTISVTATMAGDGNYNDVTSYYFVISIRKGTPTGEPSCSKIDAGGRTLNDAKLTPGTLNPSAGTLEWIDEAGNVLPGDTRIEPNKTYTWRFTPEDENYEPLTGEIELYHQDPDTSTKYFIRAAAGENGSITPAGAVPVREGGDQSFSITPDKGYKVARVLVDGRSVGAVTSYTFCNVKENHTITTEFVKSDAQTGKFVDVPQGSYYEEAVDWAVDAGITTGMDATHFAPDGICTRAQAVTFLWRAAGSPKPVSRTMPFTDVPANSYYYDAVLWAVENGITKGTSATTFSPEQNCTRAQIVTFLWRAEGMPESGSRNPFADVSASAYYAEAVLWAVKEDITKGTSSTAFSPDEYCTRAQIVTFLWRAMAK